MPEDPQIDALTGHVSQIIRALLVAGRNGAPAEGRIPFNPLYFHMLRMIGAGQGVRPSDLADALSVPRTTISTAVKSLVGRGLVQTEADKSDGRALNLTPTPEGHEVVEAILRQDRRNAAAMLAALAPEDREAFVAAIGQVAAGLSGDPG